MRLIRRIRYFLDYWGVQGYDGKPTSARKAWDIAGVWK